MPQDVPADSTDTRGSMIDRALGAGDRLNLGKLVKKFKGMGGGFLNRLMQGKESLGQLFDLGGETFRGLVRERRDFFEGNEARGGPEFSLKDVQEEQGGTIQQIGRRGDILKAALEGRDLP